MGNIPQIHRVSVDIHGDTNTLFEEIQKHTVNWKHIVKSIDMAVWQSFNFVTKHKKFVMKSKPVIDVCISVLPVYFGS